MPPHEHVMAAEIAAKLGQLRDQAAAAGKPLLAFLIEVALVEAARHGENSILLGSVGRLVPDCLGQQHDDKAESTPMASKRSSRTVKLPAKAKGKVTRTQLRNAVRVVLNKSALPKYSKGGSVKPGKKK